LEGTKNNNLIGNQLKNPISYFNRYQMTPDSKHESERMFSKAGLVVSEKGSSLKPMNVNMILFLNKNDWIIQF